MKMDENLMNSLNLLTDIVETNYVHTRKTRFN